MDAAAFQSHITSRIKPRNTLKHKILSFLDDGCDTFNVRRALLRNSVRPRELGSARRGAVRPISTRVKCSADRLLRENHILPRSFPVQSYVSDIEPKRFSSYSHLHQSVPQSIYVPAGSYSASVPYSSVPYSSVPYSSNVVYSSMPYASSDSSYGSMSSYSVINSGYTIHLLQPSV